MACVKDPNCVYLCEYLQMDIVQDVDPDKEVPSGLDVIRKLSPKKWYMSTVKEHIISCFDHLAAAQSKSLLVAVNISSLAKIADEETIDTVLRAAACPLVQINVPEHYLNLTQDPKPKTSEQQRLAKIVLNLLPCGKHATLKKEPDNNPTWLLAAVLYLKLKCKFLNEGRQKEIEELFSVKGKQLSKLLMGRKYFSGHDRILRKQMTEGDKEVPSKKRKKIFRL